MTKAEKKVKLSEIKINENYDKLVSEYKTKSAIIRYLDSQGHKRGDIARFMKIRYQHVRNVLITELKTK